MARGVFSWVSPPAARGEVAQLQPKTTLLCKYFVSYDSILMRLEFADHEINTESDIISR
jgi:hypothetical protein